MKVDNMDEKEKKEILKHIDIIKEILNVNMQTFYETNCEIKSRIEFISYLINEKKF